MTEQHASHLSGSPNGRRPRERGIYFRVRKFGTQKREGQRGDWWICYADQYGRMHHEKVGPKSLAEEAYRKRKTQIKEGRFFPEMLRERPKLFDELAEDFLSYAKVNKRSHENDATRMRRLLEVFGGREGTSITSDDVERFKAALSETLAPATVNRHLALLKTVFSLGIRNKKVQLNPVRGVKLFPENNKRLRYLSDDEEFRLFRSLPERYHPIVEAGLLTGLRASNLLGLRWRDVDLTVGVFNIPRTKSGKPLRVPIHSRMRAILSGLPRNGAYVFAKANGEPQWDFTHTFAAAVKRAGIQDLHLHDLRHTFASRLAMAGVDLLTIKDLGGWETLQMVERYAHLSPDHKRQAIERLPVASTISATQAVLDEASASLTPRPRPLTNLTITSPDRDPVQISGQLS